MLPASSHPTVSSDILLNTPNSLRDIVLHHGPTALLGRVVLKALASAEARGITVELTTLDHLADFNERALKDWPLMPIFQPNLWPRDGSATAFAILGRDDSGEIVATQAARCYDWSSTSLKAEIESLRLFYGQGVAPPAARAEVTWADAHQISGRVVYSGAGWVNPHYRGRELSAILPRLSRTLALGLWNTETTISFMDWRIVAKGVTQSYGYTNLERGVSLTNIVGPTFDAAIGWISRSELELDAEVFLDDFVVERNDGAQPRGRESKGRTGA